MTTGPSRFVHAQRRLTFWAGRVFKVWLATWTDKITLGTDWKCYWIIFWIMYRKNAEKSGKNRFWKFKFNVNQNEKRKQKRNGWSNLRGGASRPPRRFPRLRFCFRFRFDLRWIWIFPIPQPRFQGGGKKKSRKKRSVAKMKVQVMTINSVQKSSKSELSSRFFGRLKICQFLHWYAWIHVNVISFFLFCAPGLPKKINIFAN